VGIELRKDGSHFIVTPLVHPDGDPEIPTDPFPLPLVEATAVDACLPVLRAILRAGGSAAWGLYLCTREHRWLAVLPPQLCGPADFRLDLGYRGVHVPPSSLRWAGWLAACPFLSADELIARLPPRDGLYMHVHPTGARLMSAILIVGGEARVVPIEAVVTDGPDQNAQKLLERVRLAPDL
jgi:hypothetical protein